MQRIEAPSPLIPNIFVLLMCAGEGQRMQSKVNKPFLKLGEVPIVLWSLKTFFSSLNSVQIFLVHRPKDSEELKILFNSSLSPLEREQIHLVEGGKTRNESVFQALQELHSRKEQEKKEQKDSAESKDSWVLIHDGARPFLLKRDIYKILYSLQKHSAVTLGYSISDTIKSFEEGKLKHNLNRDSLRGILTPQGFHFSVIWKAYQNFDFKKECTTDDSEVVFHQGHWVHFIEGESNNFKITTQKDLELAEILVGKMKKLCF